MDCHFHCPKVSTTPTRDTERASLCKRLEQLLQRLKTHAPEVSDRAVIQNVIRDMAGKMILRLEEVLTNGARPDPGGPRWWPGGPGTHAGFA